jgi:GR25 family glycosyltransferase involved in LPS biosynthesis
MDSGDELEMIKNIYLINLDKRRDRLEHFIKQSKNSQVAQRYQRISAIDGSLLTDDEVQANVTEKGYRDIVNKKKTNGLYLTRGAVGLASTYKFLLEKIS